MGSRANDALVEIDSARQLELLGEALAASGCVQEGPVVANDRPHRARVGLEALSAEPATTTPPGEMRAVADRAALTKPSTGRRTLPRLSVSPGEAAVMLGVSRDYFDEHVIQELRIVRRGRRILIALVELERWLDRAATIRGSVERRTRRADSA